MWKGFYNMKKLLKDWETALALILVIIVTIVLAAFAVSLILLSLRLFSNICHY